MARRTAVLALIAAVSLVVSETHAASAPEVRNLTAEFAVNQFEVERLQVFEVGGVVVIRGRTYDRGAAEAAGRYAQELGYARVANLIQVLDLPDDAQIQRQAERELAIHRSLAGTRLSVQSEKGVVFLRGSVRNDSQKEMAVSVLRSVDGVRLVRAELQVVR